MHLAVCLLFVLASVHCIPVGVQLQEYGIYDHVLLLPCDILAFFYISITCYLISPLLVYRLNSHDSDVCCTLFLAMASATCL